jgi:DNA-binding transcriptional MerR regulator
MTPFEKQKNDEMKGLVKFPKVSHEGYRLYYWQYSLVVAKMNLGLMKSGMKVRGIRLKDYRAFFGLKSRSTKGCYEEIGIIVNNTTK